MAALQEAKRRARELRELGLDEEAAYKEVFDTGFTAGRAEEQDKWMPVVELLESRLSDIADIACPYDPDDY